MAVLVGFRPALSQEQENSASNLPASRQDFGDPPEMAPVADPSTKGNPITFNYCVHGVISQKNVTQSSVVIGIANASINLSKGSDETKSYSLDAKQPRTRQVIPFWLIGKTKVAKVSSADKLDTIDVSGLSVGDEVNVFGEKQSVPLFDHGVVSPDLVLVLGSKKADNKANSKTVILNDNCP